MEPSPEAIEWGKHQASQSPQWTDVQWSRVAAIFQVTLVGHESGRGDEDRSEESMRDVA